MRERKRISEPEFLRAVLKGDEEAIAFITLLARLSQVLDDLWDRDRTLAREDLAAAYWDLLVALPANPFYRSHFETLHPLIAATLTDWLDSNELESGTPQERLVAWVIRDSLCQVVSTCALIVGGYAWQRTISKVIRRVVHDEPLPSFTQQEVTHE